MNDFLNVKEIMEKEEPVVEQSPSFIMKKEPDRRAAANRAFLAEDILRKWHGELNDPGCNTREMPGKLLRLYQQACDTIAEIILYEERLSKR